MADQDVSKPAHSPKPVHIGGESIVDRLAPHIKKILVAFVLLAVILTVVFAIRWFQQRGQVANTEKLVAVLDVARKPVVPPSSTDQPADPNAPKPEGYPSASARAAAVLDTLTKQGATVSPTYRGGLLLDAGKLDEAIAEYRNGVADKTIDGVLAREGLGIALETKATAEKDATARQKLLEEALAAFVSMQPDPAGPRRSYALYHQGRIQLTLGKRAEATASFDAAKKLAAPNGLSPEIVGQMAIGSRQALQTCVERYDMGACELLSLIEQRLGAMGT
ncbi:MAG: hypothetical protein AB7O24_11015 [Kofleriaceae bacterium]